MTKQYNRLQPMFGFKRNDGLPMSTYSYSRSQDGSGRSIRMEAPLARTIRLASWLTKGAFITIAVSIFMIYWGYRHLRHSSSSIWLTCHSQECELEIYPPSSRKQHHIFFGRKQLVKSQAIKVTSSGEFARLDTGNVFSRATAKGKQQAKKYNSNSNYGPDENGHFDDYTIVLRPPEDNQRPDPTEEDSEWFEKDLIELAPYTYREETSGNYVLHMRKFNMRQSKRRTRTMVSKVESYINHRRQKLVIKENSPLSWQGMLSLMLGLFSLLIGILIWQFVEDDKAQEAAKRRKQKATMPVHKKTSATLVPSNAALPIRKKN